MSETQATVVLEHYLKVLNVPTMPCQHAKLAAGCETDRADYATYLLHLAEREVGDRERRAADRRVKAARFPVLKTLDTCDFAAQPSLNQALVRELMTGRYSDRRESVLFPGNSGAGKTPLATALGFAACQQGRRVRFYTVRRLATQRLEPCPKSPEALHWVVLAQTEAAGYAALRAAGGAR